MTLPETIPFLGFGWDDLLFMGLAAAMLGAALLVVTMRDIIRCGLAMIVCFGALAGLYVLAGATVVAAAQVLVYIGAISVLVLFAIMLTQTKAAPSSLVFQTQAVPRRDRVRDPRAADRDHGRLDRLAGDGHADRHLREPARHRAVQRLHPRVRGRERAAARRGHRRRVPRQARARGDRVVLSGLDGISQSLDAYLILSGVLFAIGSFGFLARRNAISMLMSIELMLNAVNLSIISFGAFSTSLNVRRVGHRAHRHGRRGGRGDRRPRDRDRHLPQPEDPAGRRVRRDAAVGADAPASDPPARRDRRRGRRHRRPRHLPAADQPHPAAADPRLRVHGAVRPPAPATASGATPPRSSRCRADRPRVADRAGGDRPGRSSMRRRSARRASPSSCGPGSRPATSPSTSGSTSTR